LIPVAKPHLPPLERYVELLQGIWASAMLSNFAEVSQQLEAEARRYLGARHVLAVSSCDIGLMVTLRALQLPAGSPCFVSNFTFNSTINAALWCGLVPVIVDIDRDTFNMSAEALAAELGRAGGGGVVLATHVFGNPCQVQVLERLAREHGCFLVFDAAHAYGSEWEGTKVGCFGDAEVFSLSGTKVVTAAEGGLISTGHDWLAERVRYIRAYGFQHDYVSRFVGVNGKLSELHAALGLLSVRQVEHLLERRRLLVELYRACLDDAVGWQQASPGGRSSHKDLAVVLGSRRRFVEQALTSRGVQTKRYFRPLDTMQLYAPFSSGPQPVSHQVYDSTLCLPLWADLPEPSVRMICEVALKALAVKSA